MIATPLATMPPTCTARQLVLSVDGGDGRFDGMPKSGTELSIRNTGPDCMVPALPQVAFLDARGRVLPIGRAVPAGMHPGPVMVPVRLAGGHRAATDLTWITGAVFARNRRLRVARVRASFGEVRLEAPLTTVVDTDRGRPATFTQPPLRAMEGAAAD